MVGGELVGRPDLPVLELAGLEQASGTSLTFIRSSKFAVQWPKSRAAAALVNRRVPIPGHDPTTRALILVENADLAMVKVLHLFLPAAHVPGAGIHARALVDPSARIGRNVSVGANTIIGPETEIGDGCVVHPNVTMGAHVRIGPMTTLHPSVVIYDRCVIGAQCILHGGVVIGADGFGFVPDPAGRGLVKVPHVGTVEIGNGVEIGANSCVDRGKFGATIVGDGTKIDNLVQIGHNVRIGRSCVVCGMTGIAGSVHIEDGVMIGGHVGVADGHHIGRGARVSAMSGVMDDVPAGATWFGTPAGNHKDQMRSFVALRQLSTYLREIKRSLKTPDAKG